MLNVASLPLGLEQDAHSRTTNCDAPRDLFDASNLTPAHQSDLWWKDEGNIIVHNPSPFDMPPVERFLLNHYVHRVVHLFCVIDYDKSPWKIIHIPRVLQSVGELTLYGSTSTIRNALRNALLSVSAFYLANDHDSRSCLPEAGAWTNDAIRFRGRAIRLLKQAIESSTPQSRPKYKEFLATMLSMITINVRCESIHRRTIERN